MLGQAKQSSGVRWAPDCSECISSVLELICVIRRVSSFLRVCRSLTQELNLSFPV